MRILIGSIIAILCAAAFYFILVTVLPDEPQNPDLDRSAYGAVPLDQFEDRELLQGSSPVSIVEAHINRLGLSVEKVRVETLIWEVDRAAVRFEHVYPGDEGADDSVRTTRWAMLFERLNGTWRLVWAGAQQRCQEGRGHQDWGKEPCL